MPEPTHTIPRGVLDGPPRVAENARAREWTQGTSGVGHGENAMATSGTRDGPEPFATMNTSHRSLWRGETPITEEAMTPAVDVVPTVYCFRSPHLIVRPN